MRLQGTVPWTNAEDEILKAAVQKYGLQQWGRIASLYSKRTAKQCKARWAEWIDPNIRKTEWSREEDEKLMHMAKLMPTQWRTIAMQVGRTAAQCLERYELLLDQAAGAEPQPAAAKSEAMAETLPAKPDAVDMNEEELEMLSEARARLANTLGKKAKRKARQKQLEEARRVSLLHRRRELKASGFHTDALAKKRNRPRKNSDAEQIDYVREVPFELLAPQGPYDTRAEQDESKRRLHDEQLRKRKLQRVIELHKKPSRKPRTEGEKLAQALSAMQEQEAARQAEALAASRLRPAMALPEPQVSEAELEDVARVMGPPGLPPGHKRAALQSVASRKTFVGQGAKHLVVRDELGINQPGLAEAVDAADDAETLADSAARLKDAFAHLPPAEPDNQVTVVVQGQGEDGNDEDKVPEDAAARDRRAERAADERRARKLAQRPLAVQAGLPSLPRLPHRVSDEGGAEGLILRELERMLEGDDDLVVERLPLVLEMPAVLDWPAEATHPETKARAMARFAAARGAALELRSENDALALPTRPQELHAKAAALARELARAHIELACYERLREAEVRLGPARLEELRAQVEAVSQQETGMQREWEMLTR